MFQSQVREGKMEEAGGGGGQHQKHGKGTSRSVEGISLRERGWGESREDGKTPRGEVRNERNWRTLRTEGILGERLERKRKIEKGEENWGQLVG